MIKRYKVVQDANGTWGVVDTKKELFAPWDGCPGHKWVEQIVRWALLLNTRQAKKKALYWVDYYRRREEAS